MRPIRSAFALALAAGLLPIPALAGAFTAGDLVVMRVSTATTGSGTISLDEYTTGGTYANNTVAIPGTVSASENAGLHDRHLHLSGDGRFLTFTGYQGAAGSTDWSTMPASVAPRVVGLVSATGAVDVSTALSDSYDSTSIRSAYTPDGTSIWVSGDNGGGTTNSGGLRFTTHGASTSTNLSRTQNDPPTGANDNVREVSIFQGQLYDSSGSGASLGKGVLRVGTGTPNSGSQSVSLLTTDAVSVSSFTLLDLDGSAGPDTMYTATSGAIHKYSLQGGVWVSKGAFNTTGAELDQILASSNADGSVTLFAGSQSTIFTVSDLAALTSTLSGTATLSNVFLNAPAGSSLGGIEFVPVPAPASLVLFAAALPVAGRRRRSSLR